MPRRRNNLFPVGLLLALACLLGGCVATFFAAAEAVVYVKNERQPTAAVILNADPDKVYQAALNLIRKNPDLLITGQDYARYFVAFSEGDKSANLEISPVSPGVSQLTITSTSFTERQVNTNMILATVERICKELNISYRIVTE